MFKVDVKFFRLTAKGREPGVKWHEQAVRGEEAWLNTVALKNILCLRRLQRKQYLRGSTTCQPRRMENGMFALEVKYLEKCVVWRILENTNWKWFIGGKGQCLGSINSRNGLV